MTNNRSTKVAILLVDFIFLLVAYNLSFYLRFNEIAPDMLLNMSLAKVFVTSVFFGYILGIYSLIEQGTLWQNIARYLLAMILTTVFVVLQIYIFSESPANEFGRGVLFAALSFYTLFSGVFRVYLIRLMQGQQKNRKWLFVGDKGLFCQFWKDYEPQKNLIGQVSFLADPDSKTQECPTDILGDWTEFDKYQNSQWQGVVVCSIKKLPDAVVDKIFEMKLEGQKVYSLIDFYQKYFLKVPVYFLDRSWLAFTQGFSLLHNHIGMRIKRVFDILGVILLLPLALPILIIASLLSVLTSGFPIIYKQQRTGKNNKPFTIYKLRTMKKDSEKDGLKWAQKNDSRITFFGKFFRKTRIDELPQLFNVLIGDMSFIGPRPERPEFNVTLEKNIPHYNLRHVIRPGISGWAQVKYPYGASEEDSKQKLQYDLFYIKNYSIALDTYIIFKTIKVMLRGFGSR